MVAFNIALLAAAPLLWEIAASHPTKGSPIAVTIERANGAQAQANGVQPPPAKRHQEWARRAIRRLHKINGSGSSSEKTPRATLPLGLFDDEPYLGILQLGTPARDFRLIMDSHSADLWVPSDDCSAGEESIPGILGDLVGLTQPKKCHKQTLGEKTSSTFKKVGGFWITQDETSGFLAKDVVSIGGLTLRHEFGVATLPSESFLKDTHYDGICGLGKQQVSSQNTPTLVNALYSSELIPAPIVSYALPRSATGGSGEITLGALNPASYDASTAVVVPNNDQDGYWGVKFDRFTVGGQSLQTQYQGASLDIHSSGTLISDRDANDINIRLGGTYDASDDAWHVPCNINTTISLTIGGLEITLQDEDIAADAGLGDGNCISLFSGFGSSGFGPNALIGENILRNIYFSTNEATNEITIARPT